MISTLQQQFSWKIMSPELAPTRKQTKAPSWRRLPSFFDTGTAFPPATLGGARLPEIEDLWKETVDQNVRLPSFELDALRSGGCKTSSRHLRRRTTSLKCRKRHRFPSRLPNSGGNNQSRHCRRKKRNLASNREASWSSPTHDDEPSCKKWLATHLWHAKRFHMADMFGWAVPMQHNNRGAKAALRLCKEMPLIQDATYCHIPISVEIASGGTQILRQVIPIFPESLDENTCYGEGIFHAANMFPAGVLGPVSWVSSGTGWLPSKITLFVHTVLCSRVMEELDALDGLKASLYVESGLCCLRLRGTRAVEKLEACSTIEELDTETLSAFWRAGSLRHLDAAMSTHPTHRHGGMLIVRQAPRDPQEKQNVGVCGFDIFCSIKVAKAVFQSLVLAGAAPIGLSEDSYLRLEARPPLPVFPRDWPDSGAGNEYWSSSSGWLVMRRFLEGGGGRVQLGGPLPHKLDYTELLEGGPEGAKLVIVRGEDFGKPFRDALNTCGSPHNDALYGAEADRKRRKRRRENSLFVHIPKLSMELAISFQASCESLARSLTFPALIACHVRVLKKGVLHPGSKVISRKDGKVMGYTTSASFSPALGGFHGIAVVAAGSFLLDLGASAIGKSSAVAWRNESKESEIQHLVQLSVDDREVMGSISLLFS